MATATRRSSRATSVKPESVSAAIAFLDELPAKQKEDLSLREAIGQMQDTIKAALNRGYSYEDVAQMLSEQGIQISALTLKNYAPSGRRQTTKMKTRRGRKSAAEAASNGSAAEETSETAAEAPKRRGRRPKAAAASEAPAAETTAKPRRGRKPAAATGKKSVTRGRRKSS